MEKAVISMFTDYYNITVKLCSFHLKQATRRKLNEIFQKRSKVETAALGKLQIRVCAMVFSPFTSNRRLIDQLCDIMRGDMKHFSKAIQKKAESFIVWLRNNYLLPTPANVHKGPDHWNYFNDIVHDNEYDTTNNGAESINSRFNRSIATGYKSYKLAGMALHKHKSHYLNEYEARVVKNRLRKRAPGLRTKMEERAKICEEFYALGSNLQFETYSTFLKNIQKFL